MADNLNMSTGAQLGKKFENMGLGLLLLLIPFLNIIVAIWVFMLSYYIITLSKTLSMEMESKELQIFYKLQTLSLVLSVILISLFVSLIINVIDFFLEYYSPLVDPYLLAYAALANVIVQVILISVISILNGIILIIAWVQIKMFFKPYSESKYGQTGNVAAIILILANVFLLMSNFLTFLGIIYYILLIVGYFQMGSAFKGDMFYNGSPSSQASIGNIHSRFTIDTNPANFVNPARFKPQDGDVDDIAIEQGSNQNLKYCPFCGADLPTNESISYCPYCGQPL
ncbi:MAG: hypothetical protein ACTSVI_12620 [Promethearchaeota archaeon]